MVGCTEGVKYILVMRNSSVLTMAIVEVIWVLIVSTISGLNDPK